jgi:DNA modification methylase
MGVKNQEITSDYAIYNGDCVEVMKSLPDQIADLSIYSPPFAGLYQYSNDPRDMSNCIDRSEFLEHYAHCVKEIARLTKPGRISAVHVMDIPKSNSGCDAIYDFPGDVIRVHEENGWEYGGRRVIWKEPLMVRNRTMMKSLHHKTLCEDSTRCSIANADYLIMFRRKGENKVPVYHEKGILNYAGERAIPSDLLHLKGMDGDQIANSYSQWIWRQYAASVWMDIRVDNVLPHVDATDDEDEKHVHPLQMDVIERACVMWSNPREVVLTPFMGVGSEVVGAIKNDRRAIGIELKTAYYNQAIINLENKDATSKDNQQDLIDLSMIGEPVAPEVSP